MNAIFCFKTFFSCYIAINIHTIILAELYNKSLRKQIEELKNNLK